MQQQAYAFYPPPLQQYKHGIPLTQIKCNQGFVNIVTKNGSPACMTLATAVNLVDRGSWWSMYVQTAWFSYATEGETAPWSKFIPPDLDKNSTEQCVMGTSVWTYFKNHGITPLEIRFGQNYYDTRGGPILKNPATAFLIHVLQNESLAMSKLDLKEISIGSQPMDGQRLLICNTS